MTIKQQGGIFGRNPTFNDVTVDGTLTTDGSLTSNVVNAVGTDGAAAINIKEGASVRGTIGHTSDDLFIANASCGFYFDNSNNRVLPYNFTTNSLPIGSIALGQATYRFKELYLSENVYVGSGYGIDFSATAGTGTSELFDDYEEGTFTPSFIDTNGDASITHDLQGGKYTKVGNIVHFVIVLGTDAVTAGTGSLKISGLPFTSVNNNQHTASGSVGSVYEFTTAPDRFIIANNVSEISLYSSVNPLVSSTSADMKTSTNDNRLYITGSYFTA